MTPSRVRKIEQFQVEFAEYLKRRELRLSQSREIILARVLLKNHHFGAEELATELAVDKDRVSRGTVYRTLQLLEDCGIITKVHGPVRHHYELRKDRLAHDHLVCRRCGKVVKFAARKLTRPASAILQAEGFDPDQSHIQIHSICEACRDAGSA